VNFIWKLGSKWQSWAALIAVCVGLEAGAVYFQEARMQFPCELCIYTRVWLAAIALVAVPGLLLRKTLWPMRGLLVVELGLTIGLGTVVWELLALEHGWAGAGACSMFPNFPSWAPLDEWFPTLFRVQGPCMATPVVALGLTMADGLTGVTLGFLVALGLALIGSFVTAKNIPGRG
jgi:disulfide bond formation protein DsbB